MQIANAISDADRDRDGWTGVTLYALSTIFQIAGAKKVLQALHHARHCTYTKQVP